MDDSREDRFAIPTHPYPLQELVVIWQGLNLFFLLATGLSRAYSTWHSLDAVINALAHLLYLPRL